TPRPATSTTRAGNCSSCGEKSCGAWAHAEPVRSAMHWIALSGALVAAVILAASPAAEAQPAAKVYRIGYLSQGSGSGAARLRPLEGFRQGLRELGWVEGQNIVIEYRYAEGRLDRLPGLASDLVQLKVDLIVASPTGAALAARNASQAIPIVGMSLAEPVELG